MATATQITVPRENRGLPAQPPSLQTKYHSRMANISRQSAVYFAGTILTTALGFPFKVYLTRKLGAEAVGIYALGMTIVGFMGLFNGLGLPTAAARYVSAYRSSGELPRLSSFLRASLGLLSTSNLGFGILLLVTGPWVAVHLYHLPALSSYLWAFALIMFFGVLTTFLGQVMAGYQDVARRTVITHFIGTPANIVFAVVLISLGLRLNGYLIAQVLSALLVVCLLGYAVKKLTPKTVGLVPRAGLEKEVVAFSAIAFATTGLEFVLAQADKIVLGYFLDATQVGIYAVAMALVAFVPVALQSVNQIFSPTIAELHAIGDRAMLQQLYSTLTKWILILTVPLAFTLLIFSRPLMGIFGPGFSSGGAILAIGVVGQLFNCAVGSVGYLLLMSGNQMELLKIQSLNAALMIVLTIALVPRMGVRGAALATAVTVITSNLWYLRSVYRKLRLFPFNRGYLKMFVPAGVCAGTLILMYQRMSLGANWKAAFVALVTAYFSFLLVLSILGLDNYDRKVGKILWLKVARILPNGVSLL